jgi:hypothetical protein
MIKTIKLIFYVAGFYLWQIPGVVFIGIFVDAMERVPNGPGKVFGLSIVMVFIVIWTYGNLNMFLNLRGN